LRPFVSGIVVPLDGLSAMPEIDSGLAIGSSGRVRVTWFRHLCDERAGLFRTPFVEHHLNSLFLKLRNWATTFCCSGRRVLEKRGSQSAFHQRVTIKGQRVLPLIGEMLPLIGGLSVTPFCSSCPGV
jgi:hypothetical protein